MYTFQGTVTTIPDALLKAMLKHVLEKDKMYTKYMMELAASSCSL